MKTAWLAVLFILVLCGLPFFGAAASQGKFKTITIVSDDNYPPYVFRDAGGNVQGILVDEWALWEKKTGVSVRFMAMDWGRAKEFMRQGQADVIDTIFFTPERAQIYDFTAPYATIDVPVFFHKNISGIVDIDSLKGLTVGVKTGDACIEVLTANGISSLQAYSSYEAIVQAAAAGQIKVFSIDKPPALYYLYKMDLEGEFRHSLNLYTGKFHRAVKKGRTDLLGLVEDGFSAITDDEHEAIERKWMGEPLVRQEYVRYITYALIAAGVGFAGLILFNIILRKRVRSKTLALRKTVDQLRQSEERFRIIFEQAAVGVALVDAGTEAYLRVNQRYCDIVGYTARELMVMDFKKITHPEDLQENLDHMIRLLNGDIRDFSMEKRFYHKNGSIVWIRLWVSPMWQPGEPPSSYISIVEDISISKRQEMAQLAQLNLVEFAQTHSVDQLLQMVLDEAEALTESQIGFYHFLEDDQETLSIQAWSTKTLSGDCTTDFPAHEHTVSRAGVWADCIRERRPVIHNDYGTLALRKGLPQGHIPVTRELVVPVIRNDRIVATLGVGNKKTGYDAHDLELVQQFADMAWETITRKQAETEIMKREVFLNAIVENIPNMLFVKEAGTLRFVRFNRAGEALLGMSRHEMIGKSDYDFFPRQEADFFTQKDRETLDKGELLDIPEETIQTLKKGPRILHTKKIPLLDQDGKPEYLLGISEDITERKQLEEQLRQTQKMEIIGQLAGGIAHDFNNILSGIFGFSQLARNNLDSPVKAEQYIDQIVKVSNKARVLVEQILAISRKTVHRKQPISVAQVVQEAAKLLRATIPANIEIQASIHSEAAVMADPVKIHQVIINLGTNAYHAMGKKGGTLTIGLAEAEFRQEEIPPGWPIAPGRFLNLTVADTGQGMEPAVKGKIFEPYFTTKEAGKGTGLGLAVVFGIVQEHEGHIEVHSEPGEGTRFTVYLPVIEPEPVISGPDDGEEGASPGTERIMFVDDDEDIRDTMKAILESQGYKVSVYDNGLSALDAFARAPDRFDLIVTDMTMPKMTGDRLAERALGIRTDIPVIICTGFHENFTEEDALEKGIRKYVQKPVLGTELSKIIRNVMDSRQG